MKKVNTVVTKAIVKQLSNELSESRKSKVKGIESAIVESADYKKLRKITQQMASLREQRDALERKIEKNPPVGFTVDVYYDDRVSVSPNIVRYDEGLILSDIILMAHEGKTVQQIKIAIS